MFETNSITESGCKGNAFFSYNKIYWQFFLTYSYLWLAPNVLSLENERNNVFFFAFYSLIRTFGLRRMYFRSKMKEIKPFLCILLTYSYLWPLSESTFARK